jgi:hypothetical protein
MVPVSGTGEANIVSVPVDSLKVEVAVPSSPESDVEGVGATDISTISVSEVRIMAWRSRALISVTVVEWGIV